MSEEKRLAVKEKDEMREQLGMISSNMRRLESDYERSTSRIQGFQAENQSLKDMNEQLKDLLRTHNEENRKLRADFEERENELKGKIGELSRALILNEKKLVERVIEGIDSKHQVFHGNRFEFDVMGKMDKEYEDLQKNRMKITEEIKNKSDFLNPQMERNVTKNEESRLSENKANLKIPPSQSSGLRGSAGGVERNSGIRQAKKFETGFGREVGVDYLGGEAELS